MKRHAWLFILSLTVLILTALIPVTAEVVYIEDVGMTGIHGPYPMTEVRNNTFFGGSDRGIDIFDISNPQQRILLSSIPTLGRLQHFCLYNYIMAMADSTQGILIYDVSDPGAPILLTTISDQRHCIKLIIQRDKLFAGSPHEMAIYS
ncbi:MAG: hypothetical protein KBA26_05960, partial [Candidatus Delongbacteria bacterium]|nr:hypothetical protein [Candidatus Delongbacteria bacterium]